MEEQPEEIISTSPVRISVGLVSTARLQWRSRECGAVFRPGQGLGRRPGLQLASLGVLSSGPGCLKKGDRPCLSLQRTPSPSVLCAPPKSSVWAKHGSFSVVKQQF